MPVLEKVSLAVSEQAEIQADKWPVLIDPTDNPENFNGIFYNLIKDEWNITQDIDDGSWFPKRTKPHEYHD